MDGTRSFLEKVLAVGLDEGTVLPTDVVEHAGPAVLARHLPVELRAKLVAASLQAPAMTADLVVTTVGTLALCEHVPAHLLWAIVAQCAQRALADGKGLDPGTPGPKKSEAPKAEPARVQSPAPASRSEPVRTAVKMPGGMLPAKTPPTGTQVKDSSRAETRPPEEQLKPNAKAKAEPARAEPARAAEPARGNAGRSSRAASPVDGKGRPAAIIPRSEFEVDTDVGALESDDDDIVDIVEEAESVGAMVDEAPPWVDDESANRLKKR